MSALEEDEQALQELLSDAATDEYPRLWAIVYFSPTMQKELATLVLRAYQAGKEVGRRR